MKNWLVLMMVVLAVAGSGCQKKKDTPINNAGGRGGRAGTQGVNTQAGELQGRIVRVQNWSDADFQYTVKGFLNASLPEDYVGYVSGETQSNGQTGIWFGGRVTPSNGRVSATGQNQNLSINSASHILIMVYDEFVGRTDSSGQKIPAVPIYLTNGTGSISGSRAQLRFSDSRGQVTLEGEMFSDGMFEGLIRYDNQVKYDGQRPGAEGDLGYFAIRTCAFFVCN